MFKKLLTQQNMIIAFGIPYGIFLNYSFFSNVMKDRNRYIQGLEITNKMR
jgi:hypothetical protein